ncbi:uncharacterized protein MJAP1_003986 [Malassezia japonica]|uniref:L-type lectin-like domain-containing protein n=1 Tax=Malassezia japonica TaxID=223818 RepID=A0AAF0JC77_9BASI|nr:uncharacterized protein MJAP1_003986 [Malassezia japonica]WFD40995.1 hypothetical protein MJAP1_003986 [Malassezia japonica]
MAGMRWAWTLCASALLFASYAAAVRSSGVNPELNADAIVPLRTHSLFSPYVDSSLQNEFWDFGGSAIVDTNRYVRLTQDRSGERGWLWSRLPIEANDFEITAEFQINGESVTTHGDGFALWLTSTRAHAGPVFGSQDHWKGLGIFFDTYPNTPHRTFFPRISIVQNDGAMSYDVAHDGENQEIEACTAQLRRTPVETRLRFTYVKDVYMELAIQNREWNKWTSCFRVPAVDLTHPYLGFSASTGGVTDNHNIISVWTNSLVYHSRSPADLERERLHIFGENSAPKKNWWSASELDVTKKRRTQPSGPSFVTRFFFGIVTLIKYVLILAALGAGGYFGYQYYKANTRRHTRRTMA